MAGFASGLPSVRATVALKAFSVRRPPHAVLVLVVLVVRLLLLLVATARGQCWSAGAGGARSWWLELEPED